MTPSTPPRPSCPSCGCDQVTLFYDAPLVPVNSVLLLASREEALAFPMADIRLGFCEHCGFIYNTAFDPRLVKYSARCEESQGFSSFFRTWHEGLAQRLIDRHSLHGKTLVEIGCGKGEFLGLLCDLGDNKGIGFDPAYVPGRTAIHSPDRVRFVRDFYTEKDCEVRADFLCCKMTLEHIIDTAAFVRMVRRSLRHSPDARVFFQVPDVARLLREGAFWDIYYEHCSYFSVASLSGLFRREGFEVLKVDREYGGQYVTIEARLANGTRSEGRVEDGVAALRSLVASFAAQVPERIDNWKRRLESYRDNGLKTVIWGAGSKGVAFVSTLSVPDSIRYAVDINPHMSAHYLAKSGLEIVLPSALRDYRPDIVIVMNPIYRDEIRLQLGELDLTPEVVVA